MMHRSTDPLSCQVDVRKHDGLQRWAKERDIDGALVGPLIDVDQMQRVVNKIDQEQRQLPLDSLNILILECSNLYATLGVLWLPWKPWKNTFTGSTI